MIHPVLMAGGVGSRFFPLSTPEKPKQFLNLVSDNQSLLQMTYDRLLPLFETKAVSLENVWVVTHKRYQDFIQKQLPNVLDENILLEPQKRNTAPSIAWAAHEIQKKDPTGVMLVLPSDHWIQDANAFCRNVVSAVEDLETTSQNQLVTFGICPTFASTEYGYLVSGKKQSKHLWNVSSFIEKPDQPKADLLIQNKNHFWNSGIFLWKVKAIYENFKTHAPDIFKVSQKITPKNIETIYEDMPSISIDYAIMEKSQTVSMGKAQFDWSDLGSWEVLSKIKKDDFKSWLQKQPQLQGLDISKFPKIQNLI